MTQTPDEQNTADFQHEHRDDFADDQDSGPTTMAPDDARPGLPALNEDASVAQEADGADEASPS